MNIRDHSKWAGTLQHDKIMLRDNALQHIVFNYGMGLLLFVLSFPPLLIVALLVLLFDGPPIFFSQDRVGKGKRHFTLHKFRTMRSAHAGEEEGSIGEAWKSRITRLGRILRATRLDELPQLINVLRGDINFVGPRPFVSSEVAILTQKVPSYDLRFLVKPGITGHAQVLAGYENNPETALRKLEYDLFYIKYRSIWFDIVIILRTIAAVLAGKGK